MSPEHLKRILKELNMHGSQATGKTNNHNMDHGS